MKLIVHADDYGLSESITKQILDCFDHGALSSASLLANGDAFDYAIKEYHQRPGLRLAVHLNLFEGKPVSVPENIPVLINKDNEFYRSSFALWKMYVCGNQHQKASLKSQVKSELSAQIRKVRKSIRPEDELCIDGHQHVHLIPFVFDALMELQEEYQFSYVRTITEPSIKREHLLKSIKHDGGANIVKHFILRKLSCRAQTKLSNLNIDTCECFMGILFSGCMSLEYVQDVLKSTSLNRDRSTVEILFHPYQAIEKDTNSWSKRLKLRDYYCSPNRRCEIDAVKSQTLKEMMEAYGK